MGPEALHLFAPERVVALAYDSELCLSIFGVAPLRRITNPPILTLTLTRRKTSTSVQLIDRNYDRLFTNHEHNS